MSERSDKPSYPKEMRDIAKRNGQSLVTIDVPGFTFKGPVPKKYATQAIKMVTKWAKENFGEETT